MKQINNYMLPTAVEPRKWWKEIILVFLLLSSTFYFGKEYYGLLLPVALVVFDFPLWKQRWVDFRSKPFHVNLIKFVWLPLVFILLATLNKIFNGDGILCLKDYYAAFFLLPFLLIASFGTFSRRTFIVFIVFVAFESMVGVFEYLFNVRTFFLPMNEALIIHSKDLLYDSRVYGLTVNSSVFALHIMIAFFFLINANLKRVYYWIAFTFLLVGLVLSFNRTVLLVVPLFLFVQLIQLIWIHRKDKFMGFKQKLPVNVLFSFIVFVLLLNTPIIKDSFTRGGSSEQLAIDHGKEFEVLQLQPLNCEQSHAKPLLEPGDIDTTNYLSQKLLDYSKDFNTSGRKLIWINYINQIESKPLFGNGSNKLMLLTYNGVTGENLLYHAHNSFLVLFATHGLILGCLFLLMVFLWWQKHNFAVLFAIIFYSLTQYGIFWGFSMLDVVFLYFLILPFNSFNFGYKATTD